MYVFLSDIHTKLQLFYFTAKYFMLKFFFNFASSACSFGGKEQGARGKRIVLHLFNSFCHSSVYIIIFCILLFVSLLPFFLLFSPFPPP